MKYLKHNPTMVLGCSLVLATTQVGFAYQAYPAATPQAAVQSAQQTPQQLQQLVAPIALYPDALVAQILAAATYPDQVVVADRWMQQQHGLTGESLAQAVDTQPWDPSVKALTQFPSVLANMDKNLSWTSGLGDAYMNQQQDVMDAVQVMRQRARKSGNLKSTPQEDVTTQGQTIVIQSAGPQVVYVPEYDPWAVYGGPIAVYPGWFPEPGLYIGGPGIEFGLGFGVGLYSEIGWGWNHWGFDWRHHDVTYNHNTYISHGGHFDHRHDFNHGGSIAHHSAGFHGGSTAGNSGFHGSHGSIASHTQTGNHSSAFSGFNHGGIPQGNSFRGQTSFGGGFHGIGSTGGFHSPGGFHSTGGTGGFHGGGGFHSTGGFHGGGGFYGGGGGFHGGGGHR